jgi:HEAT repeat protein
MNADAANAQLLAILRQAAAPLVDRQSALAQLVATDKVRIRQAMPSLLRTYRAHPPPLGVALVSALVSLNQKELADLTVLITKDRDANRPIRLAALKAAEHFKPPRLWAAWVAMLNDPDSLVRAHCVTELGRSQMPSTLVERALRKVLTEDVEGNVRAAAAKSLAFYAHPGLLPDLHTAIVEERHPVAWRASLNLLLPLADASSVSSLIQMLERDRARRTKPEVLEVIVRKLAFIGNPSIIQYIYAIEQNQQGSPFARVCRSAVESLEAEDIAREIALSRLKKDPEIPLQMWNMEIPDPTFAPLNVELSGEGRVVYHGGN